MDCNGISGNILNVLLDEFNDQVKGLIVNEAKTQISDALTNEAAPTLQKLNLDFPLSNDFALVRFDALALTYDSEASALVFALRGDIVQQADLQDPPKIYPRALPPWDTAVPRQRPADCPLSVEPADRLRQLSARRAPRLRRAPH